MSGEAAVEAHRLVKRFGDTLALDEVSVRVEAGEVRGLVGHNGAGKTTLLRLLFGLLHADGGELELFGRAAGPADVAARGSLAGFVEEPRFYPYLSARRNLALLGRLDGALDRQRVGEMLELVGLSAIRDSGVGTFSTGMRQRLGLAAALLRAPRLLVLDEPTIGLDPAGTRDVRDLLRDFASRGGTVFLSSHDMSEVAEICDGVVIIRKGRVVWDGSLDRLRQEAPAPAYRLSTSDDERALEIARTQDGLDVAHADRRLTIRAEDVVRDEFIVALGRDGVAVQLLEPALSPLEAIFAELTEDEGAG